MYVLALYPTDHALVAIEAVHLIVVLRLRDEVTSLQLQVALAVVLETPVHYRAEMGVEGVHAGSGGPLLHRRHERNVLVAKPLLTYAWDDELVDCLQDVLVSALVELHARYDARVATLEHGVRRHDDWRAVRLPEDLAEPHARDVRAREHVSENRTGTDARQLVRVSDEKEVLPDALGGERSRESRI